MAVITAKCYSKTNGKGVRIVADKDNEQLSREELLMKIADLEDRVKNHENREYKSRLFGFIFGREEHKAWTLELYNAINGTNHTNPDDITINTIEDAIYLGMKNDLSLLVSDSVKLYRTMEIYEQQSSLNRNMPIREFMYAGKLYDKYIYMSKLNRFGKKLMALPIPKLVCFYNGEDNQEDEVMLMLSDAFKEEIRRGVRMRDKNLSAEQIEDEVEKLYKEADPDIEVRVRMININYSHNTEILKSCRPLGEYAWFVAKIREFNEPGEMGERPGIEQAFGKAIDEMPDDFLIKEFILANRAEVKDMCLTEYNEAEAMEMFKEEGREEGKDNTIVKNIQSLMENLKFTIEQAMDAISVPDNKRSYYRGLIVSAKSK